MNLKRINLQAIAPEKLFFVLGLVYGLVFLVVTPPYQSPDEVVHFYRAYQISEGTFIAKKQNNRVGGYIPNSIIATADSAAPTFGRIDIKVDVNDIYNGLTTPLNAESKTFKDYPNSAVYSPVSYLPQAIAIGSSRLLKLPPLYLFYSGRLISLLFWLVCIYFSIKMLPFYKWLFVLLALLPMSIFTNMSMSADVVTNGIAFLLIAYYLKLAFSESEISRKQYIYALVLTVFLTSAKFAYAPLIILFLLIPTRNFTSVKKRLTKVGLLFFISLLTAVFWSWTMSSIYIDYEGYNPEYVGVSNIAYDSNIGEQVNYILSHGTYIFTVLYDSIISSFSMYSHGYIGTFGWLDSKLPVLLVRLSYIIIFVVSILDGTKSIVLKYRQKLLILCGFIFLFILVFLMQHLAWGAVGSNTISNLQGRYFIPIFPLLFLLFYRNKFNPQNFLKLLISLFSIISLTCSAFIIYDRYYTPTEFIEKIITCNGETLNSEGKIKTNDPTISLNSAIQTQKEFLEGNSSIMLVPQSGFEFIYTHENPSIGDQLAIEAWALGVGSEVLIAVQPKAIMVNAKIKKEGNTDSWSKLSQRYIITEDMVNQEFSFHLFNSSPTDTAYFDNLVITSRSVK